MVKGPHIAKIIDDSGNVPNIATIHNAAGCGEANARLIAAAPEMLAALRDVCEQPICNICHQQPGTLPGCWDRAAAAIDKATGVTE